MAKQIPSRFDDYEFDSPEEMTVAKSFHPLNIMYLRKLRTEQLILKLNLKLDPKNVEEFIQEEAALTGRIYILDLLIGE